MDDKKINLLFDGTVISNALDNNASRSGIFFCAYNILVEMLKHPEVELSLYCDLNRLEILKKIANSDENLKSAKIVEPSNYFYRQSVKWAYKKQSLKNGVKKALVGAVLSVFKKLAVDNFDYSQFTHYFSPVTKPIDKVQKISKIKKYVFLHDTIPLLFDKDKVKKYGWYNELIESINENDNYFANSNCTKNDFIRLVEGANENNITVSHLAASDRFFPEKNNEKLTNLKEKYNIPLNKRYILSLCNLDPRKNQLFAVKNFLKFVEENKIDDLVFVLGGGKMGDFMKNLERDFSNFNENYEKYIIKAGYIDDEDLPCLYANSEFFVYPSLYEGFGLPVLEAMKCGCPVITSGVSSIPEVTGDCAILINPKDDEQLILAYKSLYYNSELRNELSQKGLNRFQRFNIQIDKLERLSSWSIFRAFHLLLLCIQAHKEIIILASIDFLQFDDNAGSNVQFSGFVFRVGGASDIASTPLQFRTQLFLRKTGIGTQTAESDPLRFSIRKNSCPKTASFFRYHVL